ncbi:hypothetical protein JXI42_07865 [bacterium]|nr:hypothetical protein [bacterium]
MSDFETRRKLEDALSAALETHLFKNDGKPFFICPTGIEFVLQHEEGRKFLGRLRNNTPAQDPTGTSFVYFPDRIVIDTVRNFAFWMELKMMQTSPYVSEKMILRKASPKYDNVPPGKWEKVKPFLKPEYWGVIERRALDNYRRLCRSIGNRALMLVVYADFHPDKLLAIWEQDMIKLFEQDRKKYPDSNKANVQRTKGSGTPWANVSLGNFLPLDKFIMKYTGSQELWKELKLKEKTNRILTDISI